MKRLPKASLAAFAACALVLGACGDDDAPSDDTEESEDTESEDTESEDTESEDTESEDTESEDTESTESEDTESEDTESEDTSEDTGESGGDTDPNDIAVGMFEDMGLETEQAECLVERMDLGNLESASDIDISQIMDFLEECDIDVNDLQPGG